MELPAQPIAPEPQSALKHSSKLLIGLILFLISIVIALAGSTAYLYYENRQWQALQPALGTTAQATPSATSDPITNWKTVNSTYWTFKIPANLNYIECTGDHQVLVGSPSKSTGGLFDKDKVIECNFDQTGEFLAIYKGPDNTPNAVVVPTNTNPQVNPIVSDSEKIKVAGLDAVLQKETTTFGQGTGTRYKVYIHQQNYTDVITFSDIAQRNLLDQILSTVTFTSPTATQGSDSTSRWKVYTDSQNGVNLKYPTDWYAQSSNGPESLSDSQVFLNNKPFQIQTETEFSTPIQVYFSKSIAQSADGSETIEAAAKWLKTYLYGSAVNQIELTIDGHKAIQLSGEAGEGMLQGQKFKHTLIQLDKKVLFVHLQDREDFAKIYDQILSTLIFKSSVH